MKPKKEAPEGLNGSKRGQNISLSKCESKDRIKLSKRQKKVFELLLTGKYSVTDIKEIRDKNIPVQDEWVQKDDTRYKRYWIPAEPPHSNIESVNTVGEVIKENFVDLFERRGNHYD